MTVHPPASYEAAVSQIKLLSVSQEIAWERYLRIYNRGWGNPYEWDRARKDAIGICDEIEKHREKAIGAWYEVECP